MFIKENISLFFVLSASSLVIIELLENIELFLAAFLTLLEYQENSKRTKTLYFECLKNLFNDIRKEN